MMKIMTNIAPERITQAISTINKGQAVDEKELDVLVNYLSEKDCLDQPLTMEEEHLMSLLPQFTPDDDCGDVKLGDYVDAREMLIAEFGYDIFDKENMIGSVSRRLKQGDTFETAEAKKLLELWQLDVTADDALNKVMELKVS